jgi:hypothetical protein
MASPDEMRLIVACYSAAYRLDLVETRVVG